MSITRITFNILTRGFIAPARALAQNNDAVPQGAGTDQPQPAPTASPIDPSSIPPKPLYWDGISSATTTEVSEADKARNETEMNGLRTRLSKISNSISIITNEPIYIMSQETRPDPVIDEIVATTELKNRAAAIGQDVQVLYQVFNESMPIKEALRKTAVLEARLKALIDLCIKHTKRVAERGDKIDALRNDYLRLPCIGEQDGNDFVSELNNALNDSSASGDFTAFDKLYINKLAELRSQRTIISGRQARLDRIERYLEQNKPKLSVGAYDTFKERLVKIRSDADCAYSDEALRNIDEQISGIRTGISIKIKSERQSNLLQAYIDRYCGKKHLEGGGYKDISRSGSDDVLEDARIIHFSVDEYDDYNNHIRWYTEDHRMVYDNTLQKWIRQGPIHKRDFVNFGSRPRGK